jgi:hypothetical protein
MHCLEDRDGVSLLGLSLFCSVPCIVINLVKGLGVATLDKNQYSAMSFIWYVQPHGTFTEPNSSSSEGPMEGLPPASQLLLT